MVMIRTTNLTKIYKNVYGETNALNNCNLEIESGNCIVITGPRGSGKTTLMNIIAGFDRPTCGNVYLKNEDIYRMSEDNLAGLLRREVGYLYHKYRFLPELTVHENIILPALLEHKDYNLAHYNELIDKLSLGDILHKYPKQLSERQLLMLSLARALINEPSIILLDETSNRQILQANKSVQDYLLDYVHKNGKTLLIATQYPEVGTYVNRIIRLNRGTVIEDRIITE